MSRKTRKLIWSAPLVAVLAVAGALAMFMTLVPNPAAADGAPGPVTGLNASDVGRHHVTLSWTAPTESTVTGYRIDRSSDGFVWMMDVADTGSDATMHKIEDLMAGTRYYFRVYALNEDHTGPLSIRPLNLSVMTTPAVAPDVVTGLTATRGLEKMITLTWQQPAYNGGADVDRYCILVRGTNPSTLDFGAVTACTAEATATTPAQLATAIGQLNTDPQTGPVVTIIVDADDVEATEEDVEAGNAAAGSATWTLSEGDPDAATEGDEVPLGDGVSAQFQVIAVNTATGGGRSIASNIAEGNTAAEAPTPDPTAPAVPANLKLVGAGNAAGDDNTVNLYWNTPTDLIEGLTATTVTVQVQRQYHRDEVGWRPISTTGGWVNVEHDATPDDDNGLVADGAETNFSQYIDTGAAANIDHVDTDGVRYRVRYVRSGLTSGWVYSQELSLPAPQATAHAYVSGAAGDEVGTESALPVIAATDNPSVDGDQGLRRVNDMGHFHRIDLAWDRNNYCKVGDGDDTDTICDDTGQPSTYAVDVMVAPDATTVLDASTGGTANWDFLTDTISASRPTYQHNSSGSEGATKLVSDEHRYYRVFPWHAGRYGYPVVITGNTKEASVPGRIPNGGLRVTANGDDKLDLSWSMASNDGGSPVTGYLIQVSQDRDNNTAPPATHTWCDVAHQEVSDPPVAADRMYTYNGKIRNNDVTNCGADPAVAPLNPDGEELAAGYGRWFRVIPLNKKSETDLTVGIDASWAIDTDSQNAIPAFGRTGDADPTAPGSAPSAPIGLVAETALNVHSTLTTDKGVLLTWDVPENAGTLLGGIDATITDYVIQVSVDGGDWTTLDDGTTDVTDWTHSEPLPAVGEERQYQVAAKNSVGTGPWSNTAYYMLNDDNTASLVDPDHLHVTAVTPNPLMVDTLEVGETTMVDVSAGFTPNPADTEVSYMVSSSADTIAMTSIDESMVTITAVADGMATITVTATARGDEATQDIAVTVIDVPGAPTIDMVESSADGTMVTVSWTAPTDIGGSAITGYKVMWKMSSADAYADDDMAMVAADMMSYQVTGLTAGVDYDIAVVAVNAAGYSAKAMAMGMTHNVPGMPTGVMAESSADGTMLTVSWMAPESDGGSAITGYKVMYKMTDSDADYMSMDAAADATMATIENLSPNTSYSIAVVAVNAAGNSDMGMGSGMTVDIVPGMPTASAMADSRTQITVSWEAPTDNGGSAVTGYIVEQSYMGSFLDDGIAHPDFAFSNHMEWWETLNCAGMLLAVGSDADPEMDSDDKAMYCGHFLDTAPTNITDASKELSDAAKADVEMYFNKRYKVTDAMTMSASFMDLRPGATYMYRVKAVNAAGAGAWSATASATTTENMAPSGDALTAMVTAGETEMVQSTITDPEGDMLTWTSMAMSSDADVATATVDNMGMVTIAGVGAGTADITVTATDSFGAEGTQTITVTVESAALTAPTITSVIVDDSDPNSFKVTINWTEGDNADGHEVGLVDLSDYRVAHEHRVTDEATSRTFTNVAPGRYIAIVVSTKDVAFLHDAEFVIVR